MDANALPTAFDLAALRRRLEAGAVGHTIEYIPEVASTMPIAANLVQRAAIRSGIVVLTERQTAGRGRHARPWITPAGRAILISVGLKPPGLRLPPTHLAAAAGLATLDALAAVAPEIRSRLSLKWPNDVLIGPPPDQAAGPAAKTAGILIESAFGASGALLYAVIGIGINANQTSAELPTVAPPAVPATSLRVVMGHAVDRTDLVVHLCRSLETRLDLAPDLLLAGWRAQLSTLGQRVAVYRTDAAHAAPVIGLAVDVDASGALIVQDDAGARHVCIAGDVSLQPTAHP
jgi:BirA family biotin operon repressor/biotin-[acetyl-CoA-carboxylase] ligase